MKHILKLEVDIDDYAKLPLDGWERIVQQILDGAQERLSWQFGPSVRVRLPQAPPTYDPSRHR